MSDESGPGITRAADALETLREQLGATQTTATFDVQQSEVVMVAEQDGVGLFVDGLPVPMRERS
jgi:hypothetical protein